MKNLLSDDKSPADAGPNLIAIRTPMFCRGHRYADLIPELANVHYDNAAIFISGTTKQCPH